MPDSELAVVSVDSFAAPILIERAWPSTKKKFFEFFTVPIRNAHTRAAYYQGSSSSWPGRSALVESLSASAVIETTLMKLPAGIKVDPEVMMGNPA
jgi:hypothetical protein